MPRNITVHFSDGTAHQYNNAPDVLTPDDIEKRTKKDYPNKKIVRIDGGKKSNQPSDLAQVKKNAGIDDDNDIKLKAKDMAKLSIIAVDNQRKTDDWFIRMGAPGEPLNPGQTWASNILNKYLPPKTFFGKVLDETETKMLTIGVETLSNKPPGFYDKEELTNLILRKMK